MPWNINNKLLPIVAVVTLLALFFVLLNSCGSDEASPTLLAEVPVSPEPDADSPADTIKTLTANVSELLSEVDALRKDNADLHEAKSDMETEFANRIASEITEYHQSQSAVGRQSESEVLQLRDQVESLAEQIEDLSISISGSDIPLGIGLDGTLSRSEFWSGNFVFMDQSIGCADCFGRIWNSHSLFANAARNHNPKKRHIDRFDCNDGIDRQSAYSRATAGPYAIQSVDGRGEPRSQRIDDPWVARNGLEWLRSWGLDSGLCQWTP